MKVVAACRIDTILIFGQFICPKFKARLNVAEKPQFSQIVFFNVLCLMKYSKMGLWELCYYFLWLFTYSSTLNNEFSFHNLLLQDRHNLYIWMFSLLLNCEAMSCVVSSQGQMLQKSHSLHRWYFWRLSASWNISRWGCVIVSCDSLFTLQPFHYL